MKIIINADDFGISSEVNLAITYCIKNGNCTNTTLMVNMPECEMAVNLAKENNLIEHIGLHLNLTQGYPLTQDIRNCEIFCDKTGKFNCTFHKQTLTRLFLKKRERIALSKEIEAQIIKFLNYGFTIRHLDSHQRVHTNLSVMTVLYPMIKKYKFTSIRISRNLSVKNNFLIRIYKLIYNNLLKLSGLIVTDYFDSAYDFFKKSNINNLLQNEEVLELMMHPVYSRNKVLLDNGVPILEYECFDDSSIEYISYGQLINRK